VSSDPPYPTLEGTDLQRFKASRGEALQLPEDVAAALFGVGNQPGQDLLPLSLESVFVGTPPASHPFTPLLLSVQGLEPCNRIESTLLDGKYPRNTAFYGNDAHRGRSEG
jgi:hypothetical protein